LRDVRPGQSDKSPDPAWPEMKAAIAAALLKAPKLEPDKLADLAVLSQDIFTVAPPDLPKTESVLTMVGGKIVYDAKVLPHQ